MSETGMQRAVQGTTETLVVSASQPFGESAAPRRSNGLRPAQLVVLAAIAESGESGMHVSALVRRHRGALAVAKASTSRALRRLWRAGYVDLFSKHGVVLDRRRRRGGYVTRAAITNTGIAMVTSHESMRVSRDVAHA